MLPTLLCMAYENKSWKDEYGIFEIGRVVEGTNADGTCNERSHLGCVMYNKHSSEKDLYMEAVRVIRCLIDEIKHEDNISFAKIEPKHHWQHPKNTANILVDGKVIGTLCTLHPLNASKIDKNAAVVCFEIDMPTFNEIAEKDISFTDPSKYPSIDYDISLVIPKGVILGKALDSVSKLGITELNNTAIIDVYDLPTETSVTVRFSFAALERTLTMDEVQKFIDKIVAELGTFAIKARF